MLDITTSSNIAETEYFGGSGDPASYIIGVTAETTSAQLGAVLTITIRWNDGSNQVDTRTLLLSTLGNFVHYTIPTNVAANQYVTYQTSIAGLGGSYRLRMLYTNGY